DDRGWPPAILYYHPSSTIPFGAKRRVTPQMAGPAYGLSFLKEHGFSNPPFIKRGQECPRSFQLSLPSSILYLPSSTNLL
ncbi:MAG: hypothetical protein ACXWWP_06650, partial [Candidatus Binatia bacterium]